MCHNAVSSSMDHSNRMTGLHGIWSPVMQREDVRLMRKERARGSKNAAEKPGAGTACGALRQEL